VSSRGGESRESGGATLALVASINSSGLSWVKFSDAHPKMAMAEVTGEHHDGARMPIIHGGKATCESCGYSAGIASGRAVVQPFSLWHSNRPKCTWPRCTIGAPRPTLQTMPSSLAWRSLQHAGLGGMDMQREAGMW